MQAAVLEGVGQVGGMSQRAGLDAGSCRTVMVLLPRLLLPCVPRGCDRQCKVRRQVCGFSGPCVPRTMCRARQVRTAQSRCQPLSPAVT
ncbi:hypothetical protein E2C01_043611 [Portunus trituberculatus]|uniref:Uncharacterized protein n=1 Tax=Portunus trituberculatus TaxID=210409 RepID=A0A5B7FWJ6_PORTR|nr:hypothetical protein [Portunus trituberculatus]